MNKEKRIEELKARNGNIKDWLAQNDQRRIQLQAELVGNSANIRLLQEQINEDKKEQPKKETPEEPKV